MAAFFVINFQRLTPILKMTYHESSITNNLYIFGILLVQTNT